MISGTPFELAKLRVNGYFRGRKSSLYDLQTILVMKQHLKTSSNCVDVGCHKGSVLRWMQKVSPDGTHYAFEPIPVLYRGLVTTFGKYSNIKISDLALSNVDGQSSFQHVVSSPAYSGFKERRYAHSVEAIEQITIQTARLDNIVPNTCQLTL